MIYEILINVAKLLRKLINTFDEGSASVVQNTGGISRGVSARRQHLIWRMTVSTLQWYTAGKQSVFVHLLNANSTKYSGNSTSVFTTYYHNTIYQGNNLFQSTFVAAHNIGGIVHTTSVTRAEVTTELTAAPWFICPLVPPCHYLLLVVLSLASTVYYQLFRLTDSSCNATYSQDQLKGKHLIFTLL